MSMLFGGGSKKAAAAAEAQRQSALQAQQQQEAAFAQQEADRAEQERLFRERNKRVSVGGFVGANDNVARSTTLSSGRSRSRLLGGA